MIRTAYFGQYMTNDKKRKQELAHILNFGQHVTIIQKYFKIVKVTVTMVGSSDIFQDKDDN